MPDPVDNASNSESSAKAKPPSKSVPANQSPSLQQPPTTLVDTIQQLKSNQKSLERNFNAMSVDSRKQQEENQVQFKKINDVLQQIVAKLNPIQPQPQPTAGNSQHKDGPPVLTPQVSFSTQPSHQSNLNAETNSQPNDRPPLLTPQISFDESQTAFDQTGRSQGRQQASRKLHDLPSFSGAPEEWPKFFAMYTQSTEAYGYTNLDNSIRLQRCLTGDAKEAVECLLLNVDATDEVIEALEFRFGRPELLAQSQLRRVRDIPPMSETKVEMILPFASKVANMVAYLDRPKTNQYLANPELLEQLVQKLPLSKRHEWGRHAVNLKPCPTVQHFSEWLKDLARCVSFMTPAATLASTSTSISSQSTIKPHPSNRRDRILLSTNLHNNQCPVCNETDHVIADCNRFKQLNLNDRWAKVREKRMCIGCLHSGHGTRNCPNRGQCGIHGCRRPHHQLLHSYGQRQTSFNRPNSNNISLQQTTSTAQQGDEPSLPSTSNESRNHERVHNCRIEEKRVMFRIIPVKLFGETVVIKTYALLDEGSSVTMIDEKLANDLGLDGPKSTLELQWLDNRRKSEVSRAVSFKISGTGSGSKKFDLTNVRTVRELNLPSQSVSFSDLRNRFQSFGGLPVEDYRDAKPKILIGVDNIHLGVSMRNVSGNSPGPVATKTRLGWVVCGPWSSSDSSHRHIAPVFHNQMISSMDVLQQTVSDYFSIENFGINQSTQTLESPQDKRARHIMEQSTKYIDNRYQTGLLWKKDAVHFPDSYPMAKNRLATLERKMKRNPTYAKQYIDIIDDYVAKGYARRLSPEEAVHVDKRTWYLPHFSVFNPNKPNKIRIVFDAAAIVDGISLNSMLIKGPDLNSSLLAVLHKFRMGKIGVCADIREMFLQVRIQEIDIHSQRFLWRNGDLSKPIDIYVMQSMIFGAACSPCSAQFIKNTNADRFFDKHPEAVHAIKTNHYVDDLVISFNSETEAIKITNDIVDIHRQGGFELRSFLSNNKSVLQSIGNSTISTKSSINMELDNSVAQKILGMYWDPEEDAFLFRLTFNRVNPDVINGNRKPTKRELLSATMSVFDPFGLLANYTIYAKLILQDLWRHGTGWDEPIPQELFSKWQQWVAKLDSSRQVRIPRCYGPIIQANRVQLHIFSDASQSAIATVAYWRIEVAPNRWVISFIAGKSRCAPPKVISVPRLELQAAVLAVRLKNAISTMHDIKIESYCIWTDSRTVIQWVRSDRVNFRPFVAHRIAEIQDESAVENWHWVPTHLNVADDATRAKYPVRFHHENRWLNGPDFLMQPESQWPKEDPANTPCLEGVDEVRPQSTHLVRTNNIVPSFPITRFSNYYRAIRAMAFCLRFVNNLRSKNKARGALQPEEVSAGERHLIRTTQIEAFSDEIASLRRHTPIDKSSHIFKLMPHLDEYDVLRVRGRIDRATYISNDTRNPIILPNNHYLSTILVASVHRKMGHQQDAAVICEIRQRYWIPHLRVLVRRIKKRCNLCQVRNARASEPVMGQLPMDRLTPFVRPFTFCGVDYFGPVNVSIGRRREKRWCALFTCMTIRAVHLELATDLSTDAFILCLRNFMNIRGVPRRIRSDNGTNFVGASKELKDAIDLLDHAAIQNELSIKRVEWIFNCPSNPEAGGCWERLVQSVKRILAVTLKEAAPQVDTLRSLLLEAANIINSRPLTHLPVENDEEEPLTPNHFLLGSSNSTQTPGPFDEHLCLRKQWRIAQAMKNHFWKRWVQEYLPDLTRRAKGYEEQPILKVGSLVLICEPLLARGEWRRGRVIEVYPGMDGRIRTALIKTADGEYKRPVTKLAVLNII